MAFRTIQGTAPKRYLFALRLKKARSDDGAATNPMEAATHFGFRAFGRFAVEYRRNSAKARPTRCTARRCASGTADVRYGSWQTSDPFRLMSDVTARADS